MSGPGFIATEPERVCELCGKTAECRPYGPNGEQVCFECGMRDPETARRRTIEYLDLDNRDHIIWIDDDDADDKKDEYPEG